MNKNLYTRLLPDWLNHGFVKRMSPIVNVAARLDIHPNTLTTITFLLGCAAAYAMAGGAIRLAACLILLSGLCDIIDGKLARHSGKATKFGALYDSTLDRYSEAIFFFSMALYFIKNGYYLTSVAVAVGLGGSMMVSYIRARAEGLGFDCKVGLIQRPERILLLGIGGLIHRAGLITAIWIVAILSNITAIQRLVYVWQEDQGKKKDSL